MSVNGANEAVTTEAQIDRLLAAVQAVPDDPAQLTALAEVYLHAHTTDAQRARIRAVTSAPPVAAAYERLYRVDTRETDPLRYFVLSLTMIAMTEGQPRRADARQAVDALRQFASAHDIDPAPYIAEVRGIAGERGARLFVGRPLRPLLMGMLLVASPLLAAGVLSLLPVDVPVDALAALVLIVMVPVQLVLLYRHYR